MSRLSNQHAYLDLQVNLLATRKAARSSKCWRNSVATCPMQGKVDSKADELAKPADTGTVISIMEEAADRLNCARK